MSIQIEDIYEDGPIKPDHILLFKEQERLTIQIVPKKSRARELAGLIQWTGDPEVLRMIAEDPEFGVSESRWS